jgi:hypothetical protein
MDTKFKAIGDARVSWQTLLTYLYLFFCWQFKYSYPQDLEFWQG